MGKGILFLIMTIVLVTYVPLVLWPEYQNLRMLQGDLAQKKMELTVRDQHISHLRELSGQLNDYKNELAKIDMAIPEKADLPAVFHFLQKAGAENGLILRKIALISSKPAEKEQKIEGAEIETEFGGDYDSLMNFLLKLEKSARFFQIMNISVSSQDGEGILVFKVGIKVNLWQ